MKKAIVGCFAIGAFIGGPAFATPSPPLSATVYSWTGFYIGGNVGYSWGRSDSDSVFTGAIAGVSAVNSNPLNFNGATGGAEVGYNWQANNP
jgi:outer membrane immunogenic protein